MRTFAPRRIRDGSITHSFQNKMSFDKILDLTTAVQCLVNFSCKFCNRVVRHHRCCHNSYIIEGDSSQAPSAPGSSTRIIALEDYQRYAVKRELSSASYKTKQEQNKREYQLGILRFVEAVRRTAAAISEAVDLLRFWYWI